MEFSLCTPHYPTATSPFSTVVLNQKYHHSTTATITTALSFSLKPTPPPPPNSESTVASSNQLRRPVTIKTNPPPPTKLPKPTSNLPSNPFKSLADPTHVPPTPPIDTTSNTNLTNKLWLTSKLSPPPPPPPVTEAFEETRNAIRHNEPRKKSDLPKTEFRQEGKIFVGNLPNWVKKNEVSEFFRQFGPIKNVILIKGHDSSERNAGFGFVIYGGSAAAKSAIKAVEFDGVEFHGRVLTVKLDDGRRLKEKSEERARWIEGHDGVEHRSKWHQERESSRKDLRKVMETEPNNWQAVVRFFENIKKVEAL